MSPGENPSPELDAARETVRAHGPIRRALQQLLEEQPRLDLTEAAHCLRISARTMQRRLRAEGTTFQAELEAARITTAKALLRDTDLKLTVIALEVGCSSAPHFCTLFRKHAGETASAWRARHRRPGGSSQSATQS